MESSRNSRRQPVEPAWLVFTRIQPNDEEDDKSEPGNLSGKLSGMFQMSMSGLVVELA